MARPATTKTAIKVKTVKDMTALGVYKSEYDQIVEIYAELVEQYMKLSKKYAAGDYQFQVETGQGGLKKSPIVATLEILRKDILAYSDRLCLNPKSIESVTTNTPKKSGLAQILGDLR